MKFEKEYTVQINDIDIYSKITNYALLSFLEDIATNHSDTVGYGIKDIATKKRSWILMNWDLEVFSRPHFGETILIKTWTKKNIKPAYHSYRVFEVFDKDNNIIAKAISKWILYDTENQKIIKIDSSIEDLYKPEEVSDFKDSDKLRIDQFIFNNVLSYRVRRFDIDVNQHMHNLNYLNLAYEVLPDDIYNSSELNNIKITYKHQIRLGDVVKCLYTSNTQLEESKHIVVIKSEDEKVVHAIIEMH